MAILSRVLHFLTCQALITKAKYIEREKKIQKGAPADWQTVKTCQTKRRFHSTVRTLSIWNADGDEGAETCEKTEDKNRVMWREFTKIEQHNRNVGFPHGRAYCPY